MKNQEISIFLRSEYCDCESDELKKLNLKFSAILPYSTSKTNNGRTKLEDVAVGKVQDYMVEAEKRMVAELAKKESITETLKAENQMLWVRRMNAVRETATEIVNSELIYT